MYTPATAAANRQPSRVSVAVHAKRPEPCNSRGATAEPTSPPPRHHHHHHYTHMHSHSYTYTHTHTGRLALGLHPILTCRPHTRICPRLLCPRSQCQCRPTPATVGPRHGRPHILPRSAARVQQTCALWCALHALNISRARPLLFLMVAAWAVSLVIGNVHRDNCSAGRLGSK